MDWGHQLDFLADVEEQLGHQPPALKNRPKVEARFIFFYQAYTKLSGSRNYSAAGPAGIPMSEKLAFCQLFQIRRDLIPALISITDRLDRVYLDYMERKRKQAERDGRKGSSTRH